MLANSAPTKKDAQRLRGSIPQDPIALSYFFGRLSGPAWIKPLEKAEFFARPPDPIRRPDGVEYPGWPALHYLSQMAVVNPATWPVSRWRFRKREISPCARLLPGSPVVARQSWRSLSLSGSTTGWISMQATPWRTRWKTMSSVSSRSSRVKVAKLAALRVLAALLRPVPSPEDEDHGLSRRNPEARLAYWDLDRTMERLLPTIHKLGEPALAVLAELLGQTLAMIHQNGSDAWEDYSWNWRKVIDEHGEITTADLRGHLVSAIRRTRRSAWLNRTQHVYPTSSHR